MELSSQSFQLSDIGENNLGAKPAPAIHVTDKCAQELAFGTFLCIERSEVTVTHFLAEVAILLPSSPISKKISTQSYEYFFHLMYHT